MADSPDSKPDREVEIDVAITEVIADNSVLNVLRSMTTTAQSLVAWETEYSYNDPDGKPDRKVDIGARLQTLSQISGALKVLLSITTTAQSLLRGRLNILTMSLPMPLTFVADKWRIKGITVKAAEKNFSVATTKQSIQTYPKLI